MLTSVFFPLIWVLPAQAAPPGSSPWVSAPLITSAWFFERTGIRSPEVDDDDDDDEVDRPRRGRVEEWTDGFFGFPPYHCAEQKVN